MAQGTASPDDLRSLLGRLAQLRAGVTIPLDAGQSIVLPAAQKLWEVLNGAGDALPMQSLLLPALLERVEPRPPLEQDWRRLRRRVNAVRSQDRAAIPDAVLLFCDAMCDGAGEAIARHIARLAALPLEERDDRARHRVGQWLAGAGWFDRAAPAVPAALRRCLAAGRDADADLLLRRRLIAALGFVKPAPAGWLHMLFDELVQPTILRALDCGRHEVALDLEQHVYTVYLKKIATIGHARRCYDTLFPALAAAGRRHRAELPPVPAHRAATPPLVAFLLHNAVGHSHVRVLLALLEGLQRIEPAPLAPLLYVLGGRDERLEADAARLGVQLVSFGRHRGFPASPLAKLLALRERAAADGVTAIVFVSAFAFMAYAFALRIAPVQIWWSMQFHTVSSDDIDGYLTGGLFEQRREIDGRSWRVLQIGLPDMFRPERAARAHELRRHYGAEAGVPILGWMGREQKIANRPFVAALARILARVPQAIFLWTGGRQPPELLQLFDEYGIGPRCRCIGWVDTKLYAQVFDVYVDGFPSASGHTAFEAMAAGVPVVVLVTPESLSTGMPKNVYRVHAGMIGTESEQAEVRSLFTGAGGEDLTGFARSVDEFVERAVRLAHDPGLRRRVGEAGRGFMQRYLYDVEALARTGSRHIREVIAERLG